MIVTTSSFKMNSQLFRSVLKLFQEYRSCRNVSADEFIEAKLESPEPCNLSNDEIEKFILLITHRSFLETVKNNIVSHYKLRNYKEASMVMTLYFIIFASDGGSVEDLFNVFKEIKCAFKKIIMTYFLEENNLIATALVGCAHFEDDYVLKNIINPLLNKKEIFKQVIELYDQYKTSRYARKPPTLPDRLGVLNRTKTIPLVPMNTPAELQYFQAREIPQTLYLPDSVETKLISEFEKNKLKAQKLLAEAKSLSKNYCKPRQVIVPKPNVPPQFKAKKAPQVKKPAVEIKDNVAAVLREATLRLKEQEKEIKNIEILMQGGSTLQKFYELEEATHKLEQEKSEEEIERKHLEGLLTFEEAILAKKKLVESNKEHFKQFIKEREKFLKKIDKWKEEEQRKMKMLVKRGQEIERNAKESEIKYKEEKRNQVNQFKDEKKKMLQEAYQKQKEELAKKVKLIEEIKTLNQLKSLHHPKEFDATECPKLGLLCQMSIADLQKKLTEMKIKMQEQLEQKRRCIQRCNDKQKQMIMNVKNFVAQARMSKPKQQPVPIRPTKLARNPDLDKLRSQLEYARALRKNVV